LIESTVLPLEIIYEHRNYLPSTSIFILFASAAIYFIYYFSHKNIIKLLILSLCFITITGQSISVIKRNILFENQIFFWQDNAKKSLGESRVHIYLGLAYFDNGLYELAKDCFITSIEVNRYPRKNLKAVAFNNLGNYYVQKSDFEKGITLYNKALEIDPEHFNSKLNLAHVFLLNGDLEKSERILDTIIDRLPGNVKSLVLKSIISFKKKQFNESINYAFLVLAKQENNGLALKILGESFRQIEKHDLAKKYWIKYLEIYPKDLEALLALFQLSRITNDDFVSSIVVSEMLSLNNQIDWREMLNDFEDRSKTNILFFDDDPKKVLKLFLNFLKNKVNNFDLY
jgi:tetratricopeptide (TPR) repeat protein